ncbi:MAG: hypothetical protein IKR46_01080, partial [Clostridia bacterium]|nr:hypothetical protein [Clostridia bacterium]
HCVEEVVSRSKVPTTVAEEITPSKKSMVIDFTKHLKDLNNGDEFASVDRKSNAVKGANLVFAGVVNLINIFNFNQSQNNHRLMSRFYSKTGDKSINNL